MRGPATQQTKQRKKVPHIIVHDRSRNNFKDLVKTFPPNPDGLSTVPQIDWQSEPLDYLITTEANKAARRKNRLTMRKGESDTVILRVCAASLCVCLCRVDGFADGASRHPGGFCGNSHHTIGKGQARHCADV